MPVLIAYIFVVLIWGTTPLAIVWSNGSGHFMVAVLSRMLLALVVALVINTLLGRRLFDRPGAVWVYLFASLGIFPNMPLVYYSAQFIPSGLIAVIFALSPFVTGVLSAIILKDNPFNRQRLCALVLAVVGLGVIFRSQLTLDPGAAIGIAGILGSCVLFSTSSVLLKAQRTSVDAFNQTTGSLLVAMPGLIAFLVVGRCPHAGVTHSGGGGDCLFSAVRFAVGLYAVLFRIVAVVAIGGVFDYVNNADTGPKQRCAVSGRAPECTGLCWHIFSVIGAGDLPRYYPFFTPSKACLELVRHIGAARLARL